jgi:hypothetical protein
MPVEIVECDILDKVEEKSSTTFSFSLSPGFLSFLREKFSLFSSTLILEKGRPEGVLCDVMHNM